MYWVYTARHDTTGRWEVNRRQSARVWSLGNNRDNLQLDQRAWSLYRAVGANSAQKNLECVAKLSVQHAQRRNVAPWRILAKRIHLLITTMPNIRAP